MPPGARRKSYLPRSAAGKETITTEAVRHSRSYGPEVEKLEKILTERLSRGEMSELLANRSDEQNEAMAKQYDTTPEVVRGCLDLIAFRRHLGTRH